MGDHLSCEISWDRRRLGAVVMPVQWLRPHDSRKDNGCEIPHVCRFHISKRFLLSNITKIPQQSLTALFVATAA